MKRRMLFLLCVALVVVLGSQGLAMAKPAPHGGPVVPDRPAAAPRPVTPLAVTPLIIPSDDNIPGLPLPASPFSGTLTVTTDNYDVFYFTLLEGQEATFVLADPDPAGTGSDADFDVLIWGPGSTDVANAPLTYLDTGHYPEAAQVVAPSEGTYYLGVYNYSGDTDTYNVSYTILAPGANDNPPAVALPAAPFSGNVDYSDTDDVYKFFMHQGDSVDFWFSDATAGGIEANYDLYIYGPGTVDVDLDPYLAFSNSTGEPEGVTWTADQTGWYYLDVYLDVAPDHSYTVDYEFYPTPLTTMWRFYRPSTGTHLYTRDPDEKNRILTTMASTYSYDGICYYLNPLANSVPLYRFYNRRTGAHIFTADEYERSILSGMADYQYDGIAYYVMRVPVPYATPVYRFWNRKTGTHFYTADENEKNAVLANLGGTYALEGVAFYLGQ